MDFQPVLFMAVKEKEIFPLARPAEEDLSTLVFLI